MKLKLGEYMNGGDRKIGRTAVLPVDGGIAILAIFNGMIWYSEFLQGNESTRRIILLTVASGFEHGKNKGPLVHIVGCVANIFCRIFDKGDSVGGLQHLECLSPFGAPIGGVLFSLEEEEEEEEERTNFYALVCAVVIKDVYGALFSHFHMNYSRVQIKDMTLGTLLTCAIPVAQLFGPRVQSVAAL
ncbi:MAG: hypothetical protein J3R72DRAFT_425646 [Linnemannia gamsii]|nr:MAG: hypothetical protein J3R72DRAFT_425646 [Linnemannia gamsii]